MAGSISRRDVLSGIAAGAAGAMMGNVAAAADAAPQADVKEKTNMPEFYELRALRLRRGPMGPRLDGYVRDALIPAARRAGCGPIGAFNVTVGPGNPTLYVLIPHPTIESFVTLHEKMAGDEEYRKAAADFRALPPTDPPYVNQEVQLLRAFEGFPTLEKPADGKRIFELRVYRSHSRTAGQKKIEMFEKGGEIDLFRRVGLTPVFFAQTLTGNKMPSLTYMLTFPDLATREKNWNTFRADPEWKTLSTTPGYTDAEIVVDIENEFLAPTTYSQI